ncbi:hypothetical protein JCM3770_001011 [Rhodotorula araucariae]
MDTWITRAEILTSDPAGRLRTLRHLFDCLVKLYSSQHILSLFIPSEVMTMQHAAGYFDRAAQHFQSLMPEEQDCTLQKFRSALYNVCARGFLQGPPPNPGSIVRLTAVKLSIKPDQ